MCRGRWHGEVAVRLLEIDGNNQEHLKLFKKEVMNYRQTRHENVVLFMGACMNPPDLAIITRYTFFSFKMTWMLCLCVNLRVTTVYFYCLNTLVKNVCVFFFVFDPFMLFCRSFCKGRTLYSVVRDSKLDINKIRQIAQEIVKVRSVSVDQSGLYFSWARLASKIHFSFSNQFYFVLNIHNCVTMY